MDYFSWMRAKVERPKIPPYKPEEPEQPIEVTEESSMTETAVHRILKIFGRE